MGQGKERMRQPYRCHARQGGHPVITALLAFTGSPPSRGRQQKSQALSPVFLAAPAFALRASAGLPALSQVVTCGQAEAPVFFAAPGTPSCLFLTSHKARGMERRAAHQSSVLPRPLLENAGASRRSMAAISDLGSAFPGFRPIFSGPWDITPHRQLIPWPVRNHWTVIQSSEAPRRAAVVPPDRVPGPPECRVANPARGRHTCSTSRSPLEAPLMSR